MGWLLGGEAIRRLLVPSGGQGALVVSAGNRRCEPQRCLSHRLVGLGEGKWSDPRRSEYGAEKMDTQATAQQEEGLLWGAGVLT